MCVCKNTQEHVKEAADKLSFAAGFFFFFNRFDQNDLEI